MLMWCYRKTAAKSRLKSEDFVQIEQGTRVGFEQLNAEVLKIRDRVALIPSEYASDASRLYHLLIQIRDTTPTLDSLLTMTTRVW
jgi:hypothetical protein